ncbi:MAG TPA: tetratricopeptide repeat protein [Phnomibacter sp.]|nr:tetratricopeptide repeat protein [Phnomibacter sp.]
MLKPTFILLIATALSTSSLAQADSLAAANTQQNEYLNVYRRSLQYSDLYSAGYALTLYLMNGGASHYKDTLALVYYQSGNYRGAFKMATEINQANPKNVTALTLLADITGRSGDTKASLEWYEKLCGVSPEPYNYYQLATRQFLLERVAECKASLNKAIADTAKSRADKVALEVAQGNSETVPVVAAAYNMLGALAYRANQLAEAKKYYELAIKEYPGFIIARNNLEGLKKPVQAAKPPAKKS